MIHLAMQNLADISPNKITYNLGLTYRDYSGYHHPVSDQMFRCIRTDQRGWIWCDELVRLFQNNTANVFFRPTDHDVVTTLLIEKHPTTTNTSTTIGEGYAVNDLDLVLIDLFEYKP